jgi:hypothetical protein
VKAVLACLLLAFAGVGSRIAEADLAAPRVVCAHPATLRLLRFEDGSAQLRCAGRVLVRVSSPR